MKYQGVFFDFDYTLGDSTPAIAEGYRLGFLELGLDPNQKAEKSHYYAGAPRNAWVGVLDEYDYFARESLGDPVEHPRSYALYVEDNRRLREMCKAIFNLLLEVRGGYPRHSGRGAGYPGPGAA